MVESEGIILASPTYVYHVSAQMKAFIDRCASFVHRPPLTGKFGLVVTAFGGVGNEITLRYLTNILQLWGVITVGTMSFIALRPGEIIDPEEVSRQAFCLGKDLVDGISGKRKYANVEEFPKYARIVLKEVIAKNRNLMEKDYEFWVDKGWM